MDCPRTIYFCPELDQALPVERNLQNDWDAVMTKHVVRKSEY